jgi:flagellar M-ring protein FliF
MVAIVMLLFLLYVALLYMRRKKTYTLIEERKKKLEERVKEVVGEVKEEPMELSPSQEMQKRLETIVDSRPNDVVEIIKIWINTQ